MGVEALNETGFDVDGKHYTLAFDYADDKSDFATTGLAAFRQMVETDNLPVIAVGLGSGVYAPQLERNPVPVINILDPTYPSILPLSDQIVLLRGDSTTYTIGCVDWAVNELDSTNFSVINTTGEPYGEGLTQLVVQQVGDLGLEVNQVDVPSGTSDYGSTIATALSTNPNAVYISSVTGIVLPILKQLRQAGYTGTVLHSSGVNPQQAENILGAGFNDLMANNVDCAGTTPKTSAIPAAQEFAVAYEDRFNEYPQDLTMWAYDLPFIIADAMAQAGTISDREAILAAIETIPAPKQSISGWIPGDDGQMFVDRNARTLSEVTIWCSETQSIATAMVFDGLGQKLNDVVKPENPCGTEG
jgi:ABC-type branched-subunit amino acid transport system substrate-binding protein